MPHQFLRQGPFLDLVDAFPEWGNPDLILRSTEVNFGSDRGNSKLDAIRNRCVPQFTLHVGLIVKPTLDLNLLGFGGARKNLNPLHEDILVQYIYYLDATYALYIAKKFDGSTSMHRCTLHSPLSFTPPDLHHKANNFSLPFGVFHRSKISWGTSSRPVVIFGVTILLTLSLSFLVRVATCRMHGSSFSSSGTSSAGACAFAGRFSALRAGAGGRAGTSGSLKPWQIPETCEIYKRCSIIQHL